MSRGTRAGGKRRSRRRADAGVTRRRLLTRSHRGPETHSDRRPRYAAASLIVFAACRDRCGPCNPWLMDPCIPCIPWPFCLERPQSLRGGLERLVLLRKAEAQHRRRRLVVEERRRRDRRDAVVFRQAEREIHV